MNVIRHDDPRLHPIIAAIGFEQYVLDEFRHVPTPKPTLPVTAIQPRFELPALCRIVRLAQNHLPFGALRRRKGIAELKRNELRNTRRVEVRQVTALMPAVKSFFQFFDGWFPIPFAFGADQFEQVDILRQRAADWFRRFHCSRSAAFMPLHRTSVRKRLKSSSALFRSDAEAA